MTQTSQTSQSTENGSQPSNPPNPFGNMSPEQQRQHQSLAEQVERLSQMLNTVSLDPKKHDEVADALSRAKRLLNYARPYNISLIGMSGVGKSTLINALIGRDLLSSKRGLAATGTIVTITQQVAEAGAVERALINYHTPQSFTKMVKGLCEKIETTEITLVYSSQNASLIDVDEMLKQLSPIQKNICPSCNKEKPQGEKFCSSCGELHEPTDSQPSESSKELIVLEDLLQTAQTHRQRLEQGPKSEEIRLNSIQDVRRVQALMQEESDINQKGKPSRIIRLIRSIDYEICVSPEQQDKHLPHVKLTDTPGTGALTEEHKKRLEELLDPEKTDAIILVMKPDRPEAMINEIEPLIKAMFMNGLSLNQRDLVAKRLFLMVNKTDDIAPEDLEETEQNIREGVKKVGDEFLPDFCENYPKHVFYKMKAQPALIAELVRRYPEPAKRWLAGQKEPHFRFNRDYYLNVSGQAERKHPMIEREEAVLRWSEIRSLRQGLKEFLTTDRWEQDFNEAQARYNSAHEIISKEVNNKWENLTGKPFSDRSQEDVENFNNKQVDRYSKELRQQTQAIKEHFKRACNKLWRQERSGVLLQNYLKTEVLAEIQQEIVRETDKQQFQKELMGTIVDILNIGGSHHNFPNPEPLVKLNHMIYRLFEEHSKGVAETMMNKLQAALRNEQVEATLKNAYLQLPSYEKEYLLLGYRKIIKQIHTQYRKACGGAMLYHNHMITHQIIEQIRQESLSALVGDQHSAMGSTANSKQIGDVGDATWNKTAKALVNQIREKYAEAHKELINTMPPHLSALFRYYLTDEKAVKDLEELIENLGDQLVSDVRNPNSPLYEAMRNRQSGQAAERNKLHNLWLELQELQK